MSHLTTPIVRFWTHSIRRQLILGVTLVHALLMTVFVFDLVERQRDFLLDLAQEQATGLVNALATTSSSWVLADDVAGLQEVIASLSSYPDLRYAMILDPEGRVLAHSDSTQVGRYAADTISRSLLAAPTESQNLVVNHTVIDLAAPIITTDRQVGWARIGMGQSHNTAALQAIGRNGVLYALLAIALGAAIASIMALGVTKGLDELVHVSEAIRRGDRKVRVRLHRFDEVGRLAQGFNRMLDTVSAGEERIHLLLDSTAEGIYGIDREGLCTFINPAAAQMFGYPQTEALIGKNLHDLTHHTLPDGTPYPRQECRMLWPLASGEGVLVEDEWFWRRDGASFPVSYSSYPIRQGGEITGVVVTFTNITDRVQAEERIRHLAEHDPLTDLPNRTLLTDRMHQAIARARRSGELLGVLFLDLDNFKTINDSLGHEIGDQILCQVGHRLTMCLRDIDTVSRQGGDEFVILLDGIPNADETARLAERILVVLAEPIQIQGLELSITPSIGITLYPNDGHNPSQLIRNADAAM